eukprot:m.225928 g.225928  ORF g.225928 m.225928 type:complete len:352 (+) comp16830_c0_seq1:227-1282(+)
MAEHKTKKVRPLRQKAKVLRGVDPVSGVFVWGVSFMMDQLDHVEERPLLMGSDFKASSKISLQNSHFNNHILPSRFKIKEYCPLVFRDLRDRLHETPDDYLCSIIEGPLVPRVSPGRSSATLYLTEDRRLLIKTLSSDEVGGFHTILPQYHAYVVEHHGETFLPHYLGMYRITVEDKETYFLVMRNILAGSWVPTRIYDLKGSTVDRSASDKELAKDMPILKDNDFKERGELLRLGAQRGPVLDRLRRDVEFLEGLKVMDYSLLVGIHDCVEGDALEADPETDVYFVGQPAVGRPVFYIGIIDTLTKYGARKMAAHTAKGMKHGPGAEISTVNPEQYARRFLETVNAIIVE